MFFSLDILCFSSWLFCIISLYSKSGSDLVYVSINGSLPVSVNPTQYSLSYNSLDEMFTDTFDNEFALVNPFKSDRFYLTMRFVSPSASNSIAINSISEQIMNQGYYDTKDANLNAPKIEKNHSLGSVVDLKFVRPDDVLSPYLEKNYTVTVTYYENEEADGVMVTAMDGTLLDGTQDLYKNYQNLCNFQLLFYYKIYHKFLSH